MPTLGIDLGGTNIAAGLVDNEGKLVVRGSVPTLPKRGPLAITSDMNMLCRRLMEEAGVALHEIDSVGIATPGSVLYEEGMVERAENLGFDHFPIVESLRSLLPISRIYIENDANAAAWAEAICGASRGTKSSVMITLGTGVGGGIVFDGKIYSGYNGAAAEIGHMVIEKGGRLCPCGRRGCFEAYCSATGLILSTKEAMAECQKQGITTLMAEIAATYGKVNGRVVFDAMKRGDMYARRVVESFKDYLAEGILNIIHILQPEVILIGGGICNEREALLSPDFLKRIEEEQFTRDSRHKTKVRIAELGNDAGIIGAAMLGRSV